MIVRDDVGLVWRLLMGAVLDAVQRGRLRRDDARVAAILQWMRTPGEDL